MTPVRNITVDQHTSTRKWVARCYSNRIGFIEQWGDNDIEAICNLASHVKAQGEKWPGIEFNPDNTTLGEPWKIPR